MNDFAILAQQMVAAAPAATRNVTLTTDPRGMAMLCGARKYVESEGFIGIHNMPHLVGATGACENTDTLLPIDGYLNFHKEHQVKRHAGAGVAQFILVQTDLRSCVPFLINRDNSSK